MTEKTITKKQPICDCCGRKVRETSWKKLISTEKVMLCEDCEYEWYDGGHYTDDGSGIDPAKIKAAVWEDKGEFGGAANLTDLLIKKGNEMTETQTTKPTIDECIEWLKCRRVQLSDDDFLSLVRAGNRHRKSREILDVIISLMELVKQETLYTPSPHPAAVPGLKEES